MLDQKLLQNKINFIHNKFVEIVKEDLVKSGIMASMPSIANATAEAMWQKFLLKEPREVQKPSNTVILLQNGDIIFADRYEANEVVTWKTNGGDDFYWGHYYGDDDVEDALRNFLQRR